MKIIASLESGNSYEYSSDRFLVEITREEICILATEKENERGLSLKNGQILNIKDLFQHRRKLAELAKEVARARRCLAGAISCIDFAAPLVEEVAATTGTVTADEK